MKCRDIQNLLVNYHESEMTETMNTKLKNHLSACKNCRKFQKNLNKLHLGLKSIPYPSPPDKLVRQTMNRCHAILRSNILRKHVKGVSKLSLPMGFRILSLVSIVLTVIWITDVLSQYDLDQSLTFESVLVFRILIQNSLMLIFSPLLIYLVQLRKNRMVKIGVAKMIS